MAIRQGKEIKVTQTEKIEVNLSMILRKANSKASTRNAKINQSNKVIGYDSNTEKK